MCSFLLRHPDALVQFAEFGVADSLTSNFAINSALSFIDKLSFTLYDAWSPMRAEDLMLTEQSQAGLYSCLSLENTSRNLSDYCDYTTFVKGYLQFTLMPLPSDLSLWWIYIDFNNATITIDIMNHYSAYCLPGSVILLDYYGHVGYEDTRRLLIFGF